jgi:formamidopyrimidine-DNA glycosylase
MPELPEVETIYLGLKEVLVEKTIRSVWSDWEKSFPYDKNFIKENVLGQKINLVKRRGKSLIIELSKNYLVIHLKMTGQLIYRSNGYNFGGGHPNDSLIGKMPDKTTHAIFTFNDNSKLFFNDQRKFGWIKIFTPDSIKEFKFLNQLGLEPLEPNFTFLNFKKSLLKHSKARIKAVLLDQTVIAGIGNIYADESLWMSRIHPATLVSNIDSQHLKMLHSSILKILRLSINKGGSSDRNYVNSSGQKGSYLEFSNVYKRTGLKCKRCGTAIIKIRVASRGTHICPNCQKLINKKQH